MAVILLGLGNSNGALGEIPQGMELVAVPQGITIHVCSDEGWGLGYGPDQPGIWEQLGPPGKMTAEAPANNLVLRGGRALHDERLLGHKDFYGHTVIPAGSDGLDRLLLCDGDPASCPTTPQDIAAGRRHRCTGILGRDDLQSDVYLIFFTHFFEDGEDVPAEPPTPDFMSAPQRLGGSGRAADWAPDGSTLAEIAETNRVALAQAADHRGAQHPLSRLFCMAGGGLFLISRDTDFSNHDPVHTRWVIRHNGDADLGKIFLRNGAGRGGALCVKFFEEQPPERRDLIRRAVEPISGRQIIFI